MRKNLEWLMVLLGAALWFAALIPWGRFTDPDAFYHAHVTGLIIQYGPLQTFPWLDLTSLGTAYADQHFLYHFLTIPAVLVFGEFPGTQLMALVFATLCTLVLYQAARALDQRLAWLWIALTLLVPAFSFRLVLAKASPLAIGAYILTLAAMVFSRPLLAAIAGCVFALTHGGWIITILAAGLMLAGELIAMKMIEERSWRESVQRSSWKTVVALLCSVALGIIAHPNRSQLFTLLWTQIVTVGMTTPGGVYLGTEWRAPNIKELIGDGAPLVIAFLFGALGLLFAFTRERGDALLSRMRHVIMLALPVALTFAMTLKSRRFVEYFVPVFALWVASIWRLVDLTAFREALFDVIRGWPRVMQQLLAPMMLCIAFALATHHVHAVWSALRREAGRPFESYRATMNAISARALPGDRVFHSDWDEFPTLFAADDRLRYVSGLDPTFLHEASSTLALQVRDLTLGLSTSTAWNVIAERTGSRFVFVTTLRHPQFEAILNTDPRFKEIARDLQTAAYELTY